jgi:Glycosyl hydrolases family 16/Fibronectin type III domain
VHPSMHWAVTRCRSTLILVAACAALALAVLAAPASASAASLSLSPTSGAAGTSVTATGSGYPRRTTGSITFNGAVVASYAANGKGRWSQSFSVPQAPDGAATVAAGLASATFTVSSQAANSGGPSGDTTPPAAPTGLSATAGDGQVTSTWNANTEPDLASYRVYKRNSDGTWPTAPTASTTSPPYTSTGLTNGTTYSYYVTAVDTSGNESPASNTVSATPQAAAGTLIFDDEFNGPAGSQPSSTRWTIFGGSSPSRWGVECFVNDSGHIGEDGQGSLVLTATYNPGGVPCSNGSGPYESGGMETNLSTLFHYQYGRAEARIKVPCQSGTGMWPAWWEDGTSWPTGGEIDNLEIMKDGQPTPGQGAQQTVHGATSSGGSWQVGNNYANPQRQPWCQDFHTYGSVWSLGQIQFTVDGVVTRTLTPSDMQAGWTWPFDTYAERLFLDLQVGGWGGTVDNSTLPQSMLVDWVRVSQ